MRFTNPILISILLQGKQSDTDFLVYRLFTITFRALVGSKLSGKVRLQMDLTAIKSFENVKRDTMHVQGISYWAPANIGPYSQSIVVSKEPYSVCRSFSNNFFFYRLKDMLLSQVKLDLYPTH